MTFENFRTGQDADGIMVVTWDMPGRSLNVFTEKVLEELAAIVEEAAADAGVKGVVIASGKKDSAEAALKAAQPILQSGVGKGVLHRNTAARKISRLSKRVKAL